jgi:hypothetical protein
MAVDLHQSPNNRELLAVINKKYAGATELLEMQDR